MKKVLVNILALLFVFALTACGGATDAAPADATDVDLAPAPVVEEEPADSYADDLADDGDMDDMGDDADDMDEDF